MRFLDRGERTWAALFAAGFVALSMLAGLKWHGEVQAKDAARQEAAAKTTALNRVAELERAQAEKVGELADAPESDRDRLVAELQSLRSQTEEAIRLGRGAERAGPSPEEITRLVDNRLDVTLASLLAADPERFRGPSGKDGVDGKDGPPGRDGAPGAAGAAGRDGVDGAPGRDGVDGKEGPVGPMGPGGPAGPMGPTGESIKGDTGAIGPIGPAGPAPETVRCPRTRGNKDLVDCTVLTWRDSSGLILAAP